MHPQANCENILNKAVFLDRDGVINIDKGYIAKTDDFVFQDGLFELLWYLQQKEYLLIIITNQSGIDRGYFTMDDLAAVHRHMLCYLRKEHIVIQHLYLCTSSDDRNYDRKPNPGMFLKAREQYRIDMKNSIAIGDRERDILAAVKAGVGCKILYRARSDAADHTVYHLSDIMRIIR